MDVRRISLQPHQCRWIAHRQEAKHKKIKQGKAGYTYANPDGQDSDRGQRKTRRAPQYPRGIAQVLKEPVDPRPSPRFTRLLAQPQRIAEILPPLTSSHLAMELHIVFQLAVEAAMKQQIAKTAE